MRYDLEIKVLKNATPIKVVTAQFSHQIKILQTKPTTKTQEAKLVKGPRYGAANKDVKQESRRRSNPILYPCY